MDEAADDKPRQHRATTQAHRDARAEALEKALRANLRRRKAAAASVPGPEEKPAPDDGGDSR